MGSRLLRWQAPLAALLSACWAAGFLLAEEETAAAVVLAGTLGVAMLPLRHRPVLGGVLVAFVVAGGNVAGVPADSAWSLPGWSIAVYALGRYGRGRWPSVAAAPGLWAVLVWTDPTLPTLLFGAVFTAVPFVLGRAVDQRSTLAERAAQRRRALAAVDIHAAAQRIAAEERARLAADVLDVLRSTVGRVRVRAARAAVDLDTAALDEIQAEGRHATTELRRLLGLLRSEPADQRSGGSDTGEALPAGRSIRGRVTLAVSLVALLIVEAIAAASERGSPVEPVAVTVCLLLIGAAVVRERQPTASLLAAMVPTAALVSDLELPYGLWSATVAALLVWTVATMARGRTSYTAVTVFGALFLLDVHRHHPGNEGITLVTLVLAATVGSLWSNRTRMERRASLEASALQAHHHAVAEQAMRQERLQLARELHDVASHAVGVMVLQAGAARAMRADDPDRARRAVATIEAAADDALEQLDGLLALLEAGTVGVAGVSTTSSHRDLVDDLTRLAGRVRAAGMSVELAVDGDAPTDPALRTTTYRIVQEALTNAMRHAPGSRVTVTLRSGDGFEVVVEDDGPRADPIASAPGGFGLDGLAERVGAIGGRFSAGPRPDAGFVVHARLPAATAVEAGP